MYEIYKKAVMRLKESSKGISLFLAHDKKWTKTDSIIRSTLVRHQIQKDGENEGFFQGSIDVLGRN
jgi:hypothetical protein